MKPLAITMSLAVMTTLFQGCQLIKSDNLLAGAITAAQGLAITDAEEQQIGAATRDKVLAKMPEYKGADLTAYVAQVGGAMAQQAQADRKGQTYEFHVVASDEVNAFATPGGFVFITTACLKLMTNEAQLAGVLGHEVGHVALRHSIRGIQEALLAQGVELAVLGKNPGALVSKGADIAATLLLKGFDRDKEREADHLGAKYAFGAGYDGRELGVFLNLLARATGETPVWLIPIADHPRSDDRIKGLADYIAAQKFDPATKAQNAEAFASHVLEVLAKTDEDASAASEPLSP